MNRTTTPKRRWTRLAALLAASALAIAACGTDGEETGAAEQPYRSGEVIRIILGSTPGGGFDTQARLLQSYLEEAIEEAAGTDVRVVVENMPGAGHRIATEHIYNSPPDGTQMIFSAAQLLVNNEVVRSAEHNLAEMTGLGGAGREPYGVVVDTSVDWPGDTFADVVEYSATEDVLLRNPRIDVDIAVLQAILGDHGVESGLDPVDVGQTAEQVASLLRGETEAALTSAGSLREAVEDNPDKLRMVAILGCEREELLPDIQTIVEQGLPGAEEICEAVGGNDRIFLGPPNLPEDKTKILRDALQAALTNEEYVEQAANARLVHQYVSGEAVEKLVSDMISTYTQYKDEVPGE